MREIKNVSAVFFDMDGTLVDSEPYTAISVTAFCWEVGLEDAEIDCSEFDGVSWDSIALMMIEQLPPLAEHKEIPKRLHQIYHGLLQNKPPPLINGARDAVIAAGAQMPVAVVSSSLRESIEETIRRMDIQDYVSFYAGADDYDRAKPAPDGYLKAAEVLQVEVDACLVFEDSITGLRAARNAGMQVVAITQGRQSIDEAAALSDKAIRDFSELEDGFFKRIQIAVDGEPSEHSNVTD